MSLQALPADLIKPVLEQLVDRTDLCHCTLVNQVFHQTATAVLYKHLEMYNIVLRNVNGELEVVHPCATILRKPWYAKYVRHITESPHVAFMDPMLTMDFLAALRLCTNLRSFTWGSPSKAAGGRTDKALVHYLQVLKRLRVPRISIYSITALDPQVLTDLMYMQDLREIEVHTPGADCVRTESMAAALRERVTHLDYTVIDREKSSYPSFFKRIPRLQSLCLRDATSNTVLDVLASLPDLVELVTDYTAEWEAQRTNLSKPVCRIRQLTVYISDWEVKKMWGWLNQLVPYPSTLETLSLEHPVNPFSHGKEHSVRGSRWTVRPRFLRRMAELHGSSLRQLSLEALHLTAEDFNFVCENFPSLECLAAPVVGRNVDVMVQAVHKARELRFLAVDFTPHISARRATRYAEEWMRRGDSKLSIVTIGNDMVFEGKWAYQETSDGEGEAKFEITHNSMRNSTGDGYML